MARDYEQVTNPVESARKQVRTLLWIARLAFVALVFTVTLLTVLELSRENASPPRVFGILIPWWLLPVTFSTLLTIAGILLDILTPTKKLATLSAIFFGLLAGLIATVAISFVIDLIAQAYGLDLRGAASLIVAMTKVVVGITLSYLSITIVLGTQDDFRLVIPYVEFARQVRGIRPLILDTSILIDGRIVEIADTGFLQAPVVIPRFVLEELHNLADSGDRMKRQRGRRGLDILSRLLNNPNASTSVNESMIPEPASVDQALLELARELNAVLVTVDVGLMKVAKVRQVQVLNLNDLANALKSNLFPGDRIPVKLIRRGENSGQGVGYLEDGTMVVVENGESLINSTIEVIVSSSLQTSAGRMIFAILPDDNQSTKQADKRDNISSDTEQKGVSVREKQTDAENSDKRDSSSIGAITKGPIGPRRKSPGRSRSARNPRRE